MIGALATPERIQCKIGHEVIWLDVRKSVVLPKVI